MQADELFIYDREFLIDGDEGRIYLALWLPNSAKANQSAHLEKPPLENHPLEKLTLEKPPLVIFSHELGLDHRSCAPWACQLTNNGYAVAALDFRGGSIRANKSDGSSRNMSVLSELDDLEAVMELVQGWDFVDTSQLVLMGASQGGLVCALAAHKHPDRVSKLVLIYPAFSVSDGMRRICPDPNLVPCEFDLLGWMPIGRRYVSDMWHFDIFGNIADFTGPVLLIHGQDDPLVDVSFSQKASELYEDCEFHILPGEGHGFTDRAFRDSCKLISEFLGAQR